MCSRQPSTRSATRSASCGASSRNCVPALDEFGTAAALEGLVERVGQTSGLNIVSNADLAYERGRAGAGHPAVVEDAVYRIVQEALRTSSSTWRDAGRGDGHGGRAWRDPARRADDGVGIRGTGASDSDPERRDGFGLVGMRERVDLVHGTLSVEPGEQGGTVVRAFPPAVERSGHVGHGRLAARPGYRRAS